MSDPGRARDSVAQVWERFWFTLMPPHIYALLRITLGVVGLLTLARLGDMTFWNLDGGLIADVGLTGFKAALRDSGLGGAAGLALYVACLLVFAMMTVGFRSSFAVPAALVASLVQLSWNALPLSGAHATLQSFLFCLMWADTGSVWSVDAWLDRRRAGGATVALTSIAPLRLLRYQIALIYFVTGLWKLMNPSWRDGTAVHYILNTNVFHRFPDLLPPSLAWLTAVGTYMTLFWELSFPFMVLWRPTRYFILVFGVMMHLGILAAMEIGPFHFVMLAAYPAFLDPDSITKLLRRREGHAPLTVPVPPDRHLVDTQGSHFRQRIAFLTAQMRSFMQL